MEAAILPLCLGKKATRVSLLRLVAGKRQECRFYVSNQVNSQRRKSLRGIKSRSKIKNKSRIKSRIKNKSKGGTDQMNTREATRTSNIEGPTFNEQPTSTLAMQLKVIISCPVKVARLRYCGV